MLTYKMIEDMNADELFAIEAENVGLGWRPIIEDLHAAIMRIAPEYKVHQIKEKFGGLRYYVGVLPPEVSEQVYSLIRIAENKSEKTCERCGNYGKNQNAGGWWLTICDPCLVKRTTERAKMWEQ